MDRHALVDRIARKSRNLAPSRVSVRTLHRAVIFRDRCLPDSAKEIAAYLSLRCGDIGRRLPANEVRISVRGFE